jgi:hypothetical protein
MMTIAGRGDFDDGGFIGAKGSAGILPAWMFS